MHRLPVLFLLVAACSGEEVSELTYPAGKLKEFILRVNHGAIVVRHPRGDEKKNVCRVIMAESGGEEVLGAKDRLNPQVTEERIRLRQRRNEPGLRLDIEVVVPEGIGVDIVVREGGIRLEGSFGAASATCTTGDVHIDAQHLDRGAFKTRIGSVKLELAKPNILRDVVCETVEGDVFVRIPAGYRGPITLRSRTGALDFGQNPPVAFLLDADKQSARAFAGTPMSADERVEAEKTNKWPAGIWGKTGKGKVTFRVADQK